MRELVACALVVLVLSAPSAPAAGGGTVQQGYIFCQAGTPALVVSCLPVSFLVGDAMPEPLAQKTSLQWPVPAEAETLRFEMTWTPTNDVSSDTLLFIVSYPIEGLLITVGSAQGTSPVVVEVDMDDVPDDVASLDSVTFVPFGAANLVVDQPFAVALTADA